jgi:hypothetical protein
MLGAESSGTLDNSFPLSVDRAGQGGGNRECAMNLGP